jgi:Zn-finger nucleic acid-binding protein
MNCPKCPGKLQKQFIEDIEVDSCFVCEGIWFDAGELDKVVARDAKDLFSNAGLGEFDGKEVSELYQELDTKTGKCPKCDDGTDLVRQQRKHINIDVCPKGHGLWLDGGELNGLRDRGLVDLKKRLDFFVFLFKNAFSKEGFHSFSGKLARAKKAE